MNLEIEYEQEEDGRWIAEVVQLPGTLVYGQTREEAITKVKALAFRVLAERLEQGEDSSEITEIMVKRIYYVEGKAKERVALLEHLSKELGEPYLSDAI